MPDHSPLCGNGMHYFFQWDDQVYTFAIELEFKFLLLKEYLRSCRCMPDILFDINLSMGLCLNWKCWSHCASPSIKVSKSPFVTSVERADDAFVSENHIPVDE